jgi:DinB superfamily
VELKEFMLDVFARLTSELQLVLEDLTSEDLNTLPKPDCNTISWHIWHATRSRDRMNADLFGEDQLWVSEKWHIKFNRPPDQKDTGYGHTSAQVAAFKAPDSNTLLNYYRAVHKRTVEYIKTRLDETDLNRNVWSPTLETKGTVESRLISCIYDFAHVGQAGYVRGLLKGKGWYSR